MGNDGGGAVGTGPGHTIGAALALKGSGRLTVGVIGDGDYLMGVNALWTAAHFDIPVMIVVAGAVLKQAAPPTDTVWWDPGGILAPAGKRTMKSVLAGTVDVTTVKYVE